MSTQRVVLFSGVIEMILAIILKVLRLQHYSPNSFSNVCQ